MPQPWRQLRCCRQSVSWAEHPHRGRKRRVEDDLCNLTCCWRDGDRPVLELCGEVVAEVGHCGRDHRGGGAEELGDGGHVAVVALLLCSRELVLEALVGGQ